MVRRDEPPGGNLRLIEESGGWPEIEKEGEER